MEWIELEDAFLIIRNGKNIKQGKSGGYPITRIETISDRYVDEDKVGYADIYDITDYQDYLLKKGDILMSHINSPKHLGKVAIYKKDNILIHGMNLLCLRSDAEILNCFYAYYFFNSNLFLDQIFNITKHSVNQASFNITNLKKIKIPVPSLAIQEQIVEVLDRAQELIDKRKAQLDAMDSLIESIFYSMFGDPVRNSKDLNMVVLGDICTLKAGKFIKASEISNIYDKTNKYPCFGGNGLRGYVKGYTHDGIYTLIGRQGALCGNVHYVDGKFHATEHAIVVTTKGKTNIIWLYYMLKMMNLNRLASGAAQPGINVGTLLPLGIIYPSINLQNKFAQKLEAIEKQKEVLEESLELMEENYRSIMDRAFKGELFN